MNCNKNNFGIHCLYSEIELAKLTNHSAHTSRGIHAIIKCIVPLIFRYFSEDSTQEMLDEWRPLMCPYDVTFGKAMFYFSLFLPTTLSPEKHDKGFK